MPASNRQLILEAIRTRLAVILTSDGYQTDAGQTIFLGASPALGVEDPNQALAIVPLDTVVRSERMHDWPIEVQAIAKADLDQPYATAEQIMADVVQAMELEDRTLGGLIKWAEVGAARVLPRDDGSTTVGIAQTYLLQYLREWGRC